MVWMKDLLESRGQALLVYNACVVYLNRHARLTRQSSSAIVAALASLVKH